MTEPDGPAGAPGGAARTAARAGARASLGMLPGLVPFGLLAGAAAADNGLSGLQAVVASVAVYSATAQIAAFQLLGSGGAVGLAVGTALLLNVRFLLLGLSLAPHLADMPSWKRAVAGYLMTTQAFAVVSLHWRNRPSPSRGERWAYYLGAACPVWLVYQGATVAGVLAGDGAGRLLAVALPLAFLVLLVPMLDGRRSVTAAVTAGVVAVAGTDWPAGLGTPAAITAGLAVGMAVPRARDADMGLASSEAPG